jgi:hypothetical protein
VVSIDGYDIFQNLKGHHLGFQEKLKNFMLPLEPKLLVMFRRIVEALKILAP